MGTRWDRSRIVELDNNGIVAPGAEAYFFDVDTTIPRTTYQDADFQTTHAHPVEADGNGRWPLVFLQFGSFDVQVKTAGGAQLFYDTGIPNPEPFDEEFEIDEDKLIQTGFVELGLGNETRDGFVRLNGRTIGNAASTATERADEDCEDLFIHIYNRCSNTTAPVSGGRGTGAGADFNAGKRLTLPNYCSAVLVGFPDMGNTDNTLLDSAPVVLGSTTAPGSLLGANTHVLLSSQMAGHTHTFTTTSGTQSANHTHNISAQVTGTESQSHTHTGTSDSQGAHTHTVTNGGTVISAGGTTLNLNASGAAGSSVALATGSDGAHTHTTTTGTASQTHTHSLSGITTTESGTHTHSVTGTTDTTGSNVAHNNLSRAAVVTFYIKL